MKCFFEKQPPITISYRDYKGFNQHLFRKEILKELFNVHKGNVEYDTFEKTVVNLLNIFAPIKEKYA